MKIRDRKTWVIILVIIGIILGYGRYRNQGVFHTVKNIIENNPGCETFRVNDDGSETTYREYRMWGIAKDISGLSFEYRGQRVKYEIKLNNYTKIADGGPGKELGIKFTFVDSEGIEGRYSQYYHFGKKEVSKYSTVYENGELIESLSGKKWEDPIMFPEEIEEVLRMIEKDIQSRASRCWY